MSRGCRRGSVLMIAISGCMNGPPVWLVAHRRGVTYAMVTPSGDHDGDLFWVSAAPMRVFELSGIGIPVVIAVVTAAALAPTIWLPSGHWLTGSSVDRVAIRPAVGCQAGLLRNSFGRADVT